VALDSLGAHVKEWPTARTPRFRDGPARRKQSRHLAIVILTAVVELAIRASRDTATKMHSLVQTLLDGPLDIIGDIHGELVGKYGESIPRDVFIPKPLSAESLADMIRVIVARGEMGTEVTIHASAGYRCAQQTPGPRASGHHCESRR